MLIRQANQKRDIFLYWYFLDKGFKFQPDGCNGCHDILMISMTLSNIAVLNIHSCDYRFIMNGISKSEVVNLLQKAELKEKSGTL